ncbi:hypothetical protein [Pseudoxanthomonas gei]|uniref:hypothetical protein n=1 Tax=Pseudoxanthomonas gei TaxID=1383030 RepID=UPI003CCD33DD
MSINSKIRREAGKQGAAKADGRKRGAAPIEPHAQLRDQQGRLLAGIVRQEGEWVLGMGGQIAGSSASAAHVFAMIRRAALLHEAQGTPVRLTWSDALKDAAWSEVAERAMSFEEFEAGLARDMAEVAARKADTASEGTVPDSSPPDDTPADGRPPDGSP